MIGKSTDKYYKWRQIPAWVLGGAAILGGAVLIAPPCRRARGSLSVHATTTSEAGVPSATSVAPVPPPAR